MKFEIVPFEIRRPASAAGLIFDSPHSGRFYPDDWPTSATRLELRRGEDAYVDELIVGAVVHGVPVLLANYPRCFIDLNRAPDDIDAELLAEPWPGPLSPTEKTRKGLGLIRRFVVPGVDVNARPLTVSEVQARIDRIHRPYLEALDALVAEQRAKRAKVLHVNWHSMKSAGNTMTPDGPGARRADFVVSDREGGSASHEVTAFVSGALRDLGYRVAVNDPYKGGSIVHRVGNPARGVHSVQVEINRGLYLDEVKVEKAAGFERLRADLMRLAAALAAALVADGIGGQGIGTPQ
jgi:N-formylglutamate deformylase